MIRTSTAVWRDAQFQVIADAAKKGCPLSKALPATPITLSAKLS